VQALPLQIGIEHFEHLKKSEMYLSVHVCRFLNAEYPTHKKAQL